MNAAGMICLRSLQKDCQASLLGYARVRDIPYCLLSQLQTTSWSLLFVAACWNSLIVYGCACLSYVLPHLLPCQSVSNHSITNGCPSWFCFMHCFDVVPFLFVAFTWKHNVAAKLFAKMAGGSFSPFFLFFGQNCTCLLGCWDRDGRRAINWSLISGDFPCLMCGSCCSTACKSIAAFNIQWHGTNVNDVKQDHLLCAHLSSIFSCYVLQSLAPVFHVLLA